MKKLWIAFALVIALAATVNAQMNTTSERLNNLERPGVTLIASNATTAQIDFRQGQYAVSGAAVVGTENYAVKNLANALSLQLTNLVPGVTRWVWITTDGTERAISILTNGITTSTRINYSMMPVNTNGSSAFSVTNRHYAKITVMPQGEVSVVFGALR